MEESDPYELPEDAEGVIDATGPSPEETGQEVILYLEKSGFLGATNE